MIRKTENINISQADYQDHFRDIFHAIPMGIALTDSDGKLLVCNQEFGIKTLQSGHSIDLSAYIGNDLNAKRVSKEINEFPITDVMRLCRMDLPHSVHEAAFLWFIRVAGGDNKDHVSEVKKLYRAFIDSTFELIFRTDASDALLFTNKLFIKRFEFSSFKEAKGYALCNLFENAQAFESFKSRILAEKRIHNETIKFKTLSGKPLVGLINCQLHIDQKNNPVLHWTVLDISERVQFEEKLRQKNEQLAKLNTQMEKFLYSTSHDLRSPLTSILGLVNLLRLEISDKNILEYVARIESSTLKLDKIIRDIMSFSKTTYQGIKSERIHFDRLLWKTINNYRNDHNFNLIQFEVNVHGNTIYYSDGERLEIILDSLIRNCVHFADPQKVRSFVRINVTLSADQSQIEIMDNGMGIGKPHLDQIFNMFYKASLHSRGAGLGLYIVKEGVEQLKGAIQVESEIGFGSVFKIQIPNDHKGKLINRKLQLRTPQ